MGRIWAAAVGLILSAICSGSVSVTRTSFAGWRGSWRISNGCVDLVFVPATGRIMRFGFVGGPNVLWNDPKLAGKRVPLTEPAWADFGGDKVWAAPQSDWNWPPDPVLERGIAGVRKIAGGIAVRGMASHGLRVDRRIVMDAEGNVSATNTLTNVSDRPMRKSVWEVCQVDDPDHANMAIGGPDRMPQGWVTLQGNGGEEFVKWGDHDSLTIGRDKLKIHKYGARSNCLISAKGRLYFLMNVDFVTGADYPDGGCSVEVFTSSDPRKLMELELLGPIQRLDPGRSASITVLWGLMSIKAL